MEGTIRLNKYLSDAGVCSRREADRLVEEGKVLVDGEIAVMGMQIRPGQKVVCDGKPVGEKEKPVFLIVNKPRGIVCTTSDKDHAENIVEFLNYPQRIYPVGRLDKDSEGLLLMTNQGDIVNKILRGASVVENKSASIGDGELMVQRFVKLAKRTPNMIGAMFRICFPVAENPTIVKIPPIVGPFNSPPTPRIKIVANKPLTAILRIVAAPPLSRR